MQKLNILIILVALSAFFSCAPDTSEIPEDLEGKKAFVIQKNEEIRALEQLVKQVSEEIEKLEPKKERATPVSVFQAEKSDFKRYVDIQGAVLSNEAVFASSEMGGRIEQLNADEGDYVRKGQRIAKIDLESISKQIEEVRKSLELANDVYLRQENLWNQNIGSEVQFLQAKNNKERLEKTLSSLEFQLSKANVKAPISGYVDRVFTKEGEFAGPGAPIVQIIDTKRVKVVADVPESYLGVVAKGDKVGLHFPALQKNSEANISMIGRTIDPSNRTFKVEVEISNTSGDLKPNLLALMKINDLTIEDVIILPVELVQQEVSGKDYIYVVDETDAGPVSKKVYVETGESAKGNIVITNGLQGGETVIKDGARGLASGEKIKATIINTEE